MQTINRPRRPRRIYRTLMRSVLTKNKGTTLLIRETSTDRRARHGAPRSPVWRWRWPVLVPPLRRATRTAGQTDAGRRPRAGAAAAGSAVHVDTAPLQHITVERRVDLSGTLVSPDQARVSSEVAGIIMEVPVQLGSEVRVGDALGPHRAARARARVSNEPRAPCARSRRSSASTAPRTSSRRPTTRSRRSARRWPTATMPAPRTSARNS